MSKNIELGLEGRKKLLKGITKLADAVVCTLGPNGRNVLMGDANSIPKITKDGVSVAKSISFEDEVENLGAQLVKQASIKTAEEAGDGTTTSTLLTREMVEDGMDFISSSKTNATEIKRDIEKSIKKVIDKLNKDISQDISGEHQLEQIATISANNDPEVGKLIAEAINKVGKDGIVHIEESKSNDTYLETVEGMQFDRGYKSHFFVTDNNTMTCNLNDPLILMANHKFTGIKELLPILEYVSTNNKSLLIIAEDIEAEALATLIVNKSRGILKVAAIKAPDFGDRRKLILDDIAILTGGTVFDKDKGMKLEKFESGWLGSCRAVTITKDKTTIIDGKGSEENITQRIEELKTQADNSKTPYETEKLQERLAKLLGGVSIIHVGGNNETEMSELKDRVDDALQATKAALEEGIIPGGGIALLYAREVLSKELNNIGASIVYKACGKPFTTILKNAGFEDEEIHNILTNLTKKSKKDYWKGYNLKTNKIVNMKEAGIIDPTKVLRCALTNASSVASTILLTECIITNTKEKNKQSPEEGVDINQFM